MVFETGANIITVGRQLALLLFEMINLKIVRAKDIHLIGHSLGAQVTHQTSEWLRHLTKSDSQPQGLRPGRITGLDPAALLFQRHPGTHLVEEDADFVDVIHTSIVYFTGGPEDFLFGRFGMSQLVGSVDFFPNGGTAPQPSCSKICLLSVACLSCSHSKCRGYFADSLVDHESQVYGMSDLLYPSWPCGDQASTGHGSSVGMQAVKFSGRGRQCSRI